MSLEADVLFAVCRDGAYLQAADLGVREEAFSEYAEEYGYLAAYFEEHRRTPGWGHVVRRFPHLDGVGTKQDLYSLCVDLGRQHLRRRYVASLEEGVGVLERDGPEAAVAYHAQALRELVVSSGEAADLDIVHELEARVAEQRRRYELAVGGRTVGIPTGIPSLDRALGGWDRSDFVVVIGNTGVGKSFLLMQFAHAAWAAGYPVLYVSLEMPHWELGFRFDAFARAVKNSSLFAGRMDPEKYEEAIRPGRGEPSFVVVGSNKTRPMTPAVVDAKIEQYGPGVVFVDYVSLMAAGRRYDSDWLEMKGVAQQLKLLAEVHKVPVIAAAQAIRSAKLRRAIRAEDVAYSYAITQPADVVLGVSRPRDGDELRLTVSKSRSAAPPSGEIRLAFQVDEGRLPEVGTDGGVL